MASHARFVQHCIVVEPLRVASKAWNTLDWESRPFITVVTNGAYRADNSINRRGCFRISLAIVPLCALVSRQNGRFAWRVAIVTRRAGQAGNSSLLWLVLACLARRPIQRFGSFDAIVTRSAFLGQSGAFDAEETFWAHEATRLVLVWLVSSSRARCSLYGSFGAIFALNAEGSCR